MIRRSQFFLKVKSSNRIDIWIDISSKCWMVEGAIACTYFIVTKYF
jgi:hypothetical protein